MDYIYHIISGEIVEAIGWTLFHSIWQGALISLLLGLLMLLLNKFTSQTRYFVAFFALSLILVSSTITFYKSFQHAKEKTLIKERIIANPTILIEHLQEDIQSAKMGEPENQNTVKLKWIFFKSYFQKHYPLIVTIWLLGILVLFLRFLGGLAYAVRIKNYRTIAVDKTWKDKLNRLAKNLELKKAIKMFQSPLTKVPVVIGYFKPVILLPISTFIGLTSEEIENIIAHELAHIYRKDYLFNIIQTIIEILFFYHPAIWWISSVIRSERENSCDDIAIELTGDSLNYAKALASMQEQVLKQESLVMAIATNKNQLFKRVKRLLNQPKMRTNFTEGFIASCIVFISIIALSISINAYSINKSSNEVGKSKEVNAEFIQEQNKEYEFKYADSVKKINNKEIERYKQEFEKQEDELEELKEEAKKHKQNYYDNKYDFDDELKDLLKDIEGLDEVSEEVAREIEIALSDMDDELTVEILHGIRGALNNMDINLIVHEALEGAQAAIDSMDINIIVNGAMQDEIDNNCVDVDKITSEALKGASAALEAMDLNMIVNEALKGVEGALSEMDLNVVINDAINEEIYIYHNRSGSGNWQHYEIIYKGSKIWNDWRENNTDIIPNLSYMEFEGLEANKANFSDAKFIGTRIKESKMEKCSFAAANLATASIKETLLEGSDFKNATLNNTNFKENKLMNSDFRYANLQYAVFKECDLTNANFKGADLRNCTFEEVKLDNCIFEGALANSSTIFPEGFNPQKHGIEMK
ncbi:MAG: pentapeptide repeat-containing protein [Bacteroidales bacterium]|nr:pentapeptide repeat-containing protein [Bacteroidales bacterium]